MRACVTRFRDTLHEDRVCDSLPIKLQESSFCFCTFARFRLLAIGGRAEVVRRHCRRRACRLLKWIRAALPNLWSRLFVNSLGLSNNKQTAMGKRCDKTDSEETTLLSISWPAPNLIHTCIDLPPRPTNEADGTFSSPPRIRSSHQI